MATWALSALETALGDVQNLMDHHPKAKDPGRGRPTSDEGPLNRACIVLLYAAWEVYVEDSVIAVVDQLCADAEHADHLPEQLRAFAAERVKDGWRFAGDGWRQAVADMVTEHVRGADDGTSFGINSAGPKQVLKLHAEVLGVDLLNECRWQGKSAQAIKRDLAALVTQRGEIAHTGRVTKSPLSMQIVRNRRDFVRRLAVALDVQLESWISGLAGLRNASEDASIGSR